MTNGAGAVTSAVATLTVLVPPAIVAQPQSQTVTQGGTAAFSLTATGTAPLSYQWRFNGTNLSGGTLSYYTLGNVRTNKSGNYTVTVTNGAGMVTSAVATLTVLVPTVAQPGYFDSITLQAGGSVRLCMTGTPGSSYVLEGTEWVDWVTLWTNSSTDGCLQWADSSATNAGQRFYRLRLIP